MNLLEFLLFVLLSAVMFFAGDFLSRLWGPICWLVVVPIAYLWLRLIFRTIRSFFTRKEELSRSRPACRQGKCQSKDYTLVDPRPSNTVFRCRCGDLYLSQGNYFSQIVSGSGSIQPYMVRDRSGEWKPDGEVQPTPSVQATPQGQASTFFQQGGN